MRGGRRGLGSQSRLVGEVLPEAEPTHATNSAARARARRRGDAPPFDNGFERPKAADLAADRARAQAAIAAARLAEAEKQQGNVRAAIAGARLLAKSRQGRPKTPDTRPTTPHTPETGQRAVDGTNESAQAPDDADAAKVDGGGGRRPSFGSQSQSSRGSTAQARADGGPSMDPAVLQPKLEKIWFDLRMPMVSKLQFLQKYASVQHAPLLPKAVEVWGVAADAYQRRAKLGAVLERLTCGELFAATDFVALVSKALGPDDPPPPDVLKNPSAIINTPTGDYGAIGRAAADVWLADCIGLYTTRCLDVADRADRELGDQLPDLKTFTPNPAK